MSSLAIFAIGPAGTGKTSFCGKMYDYLQTCKRDVYYVNLDPSCKSKIPSVFDIADLISTEDVMLESDMGPNGGLIECFRGVVDVIDDIDIFEYPDGSVVLVDCPGQLELYMHYSYVKSFSDQFEKCGLICCSAYFIESHYLNNEEKFIAACISCLCAYSLLSLPQVNILSKVDNLLSHNEDQESDDYIENLYSKFEEFTDLDQLRDKILNSGIKPPQVNLALRMLDLLEDLGITDFIPFETKSVSLCEHVFLKICENTHFGENDEVSSIDSYNQG